MKHLQPSLEMYSFLFVVLFIYILYFFKNIYIKNGVFRYNVRKMSLVLLTHSEIKAAFP
jgi:hypothetical protein